MRIVTLIIMAMWCGAAVSGQTDYDSYAIRAERYFGYGEWASSGAIYSIMIGERPEVISNYSHAIVAAGMQADSASEVRLTHLALSNRINVDSLFTSVERISFEVGQTSMYERYLLLVRDDSPWLARVINGYLLRYYSYRSYGPGIVEYSKLMLEGADTDERFLMSLARGYLLCGRVSDAVDVYIHVAEVNPQNYKAILYLANYYSGFADDISRTLARQYFQAAYNMHPTPYVAEALKNL